MYSDRSKRIVSLLFITFLLCFVVLSGVRAEKATVEEMNQVCQNWLSQRVFQSGSWAGSDNPKILSIDEIFDGNQVIGLCYNIEPQGFVIVPVLKELPPIKVFSEDCNLDINKTEGMAQLIKDILNQRTEVFINNYGSMEYVEPVEEGSLFGGGDKAQWDKYSMKTEEFNSSFTKSAMLQTGPLMTVSWDQGAPYNNLCPMGYGGYRTVVGCVATAAAQIMKYHQWPPFGYGDHTYTWSGDNSCDGGSTPAAVLSAEFWDDYDWDNMPDRCTTDSSEIQQASVAELSYETGVAFEMDYGACGSGVFLSAIPFVMNQWEKKFRYLDQMENRWRGTYNSNTWFSLIQEQIDINQPMEYFMTSHAVVCDGWRIESSFNQYHLNYGWDEGHTAWYTVDNYYCPDEDGCSQDQESVIRNILPNRGIMLEADTTFGWAPFDVNFTGSSTHSVSSWDWDFGDSQAGSGETPLHTYTENGIFDIGLVIDTGGDTLSISRREYVIVLADTLVGPDQNSMPGSILEIAVLGRNTCPLQTIYIPLEIDGTMDMDYDSFSTEGCRTDYFESASRIYSDSWLRRWEFKLVSSAVGTSPDLEPGYGEIIKFYFSIPYSANASQKDTVKFNGFTTHLPKFISNYATYAPMIENSEVSVGTPSCCALRGDVANPKDFAVLVNDVVFLVNYIFKSGPAPSCLDEGDCALPLDGNILVNDVVFLVNYIFKSGPTPSPC